MTSCFYKYAGLAFVVQSVIWLIVGRWDAVVEKLVYVYYPTIWVVEKFGNFKGESRLIEPLLIGVPLGILLYSIIFALLLALRPQRH